jgi:3-oxoacyl-[acyl-carrier-protein] synthase-3
VRISGVGAALPDSVMSNARLERVMDTSDEWILQRTGIRERRRYDPDAAESTSSLAAAALRTALHNARLNAADLDLIVCATMTPDMPTPSVACTVADAVGCRHIGAVDLNAACSGFVFALNFAHEMIRGGLYRRVALLGVDTITRFCDYSTFGRGAAILFGDGAGAFILDAVDPAIHHANPARPTPARPTPGLIAQAMHSDGGGAKTLFIPCRLDQFYQDQPDERKIERIQMNGQAVFKFAVSKFPEVIQETLDLAGLTPADVDHFVCHQANARILESARERFGLAPDKLHINIDRLGNTVAASCPLVFDELVRAGRVHPGQRVMFIAFGAGLTWGASLWQL